MAKRGADTLVSQLVAASETGRPAPLMLPPEAMGAEPRELSPFSEAKNTQQPQHRARVAVGLDFVSADGNGKLEEIKTYINGYIQDQITKMDERVGKVESKLDDKFRGYNYRIKELFHNQALTNTRQEELETGVDRNHKNLEQALENVRGITFDEIRGACGPQPRRQHAPGRAGHELRGEHPEARGLRRGREKVRG